MRRLFWALVRIALLSYIGLCVVLYFIQSRLIYYPDRTLVGSPRDAGLAYEDVTLQAKDGVKLHGWYVPAADERAVLLFCHGNAGNISHRVGMIDAFHRLRLSVFIFDYRGYGRSEGKPTEKGTYLDSEAAWDYLTETRRVPPERIVIFGRSLGGAIAAHLAKDRAPGALILGSAATSVVDMGKEMYPYLPVRWLCRFQYATVEYVRQVRCPVLVIHSVEDELVPFHHGQRIFEAAPQPKQFLRITGGHNEGYGETAGAYPAGLEKFLNDFSIGSRRP